MNSLSNEKRKKPNRIIPNYQKEIINDEYYTYYRDVSIICDMTRNSWEHKIIYLPFDSFNSNFYKYFKNELKKKTIKRLINKTLIDGKEVIYEFELPIALNNMEVLNLDDLMVISNPPFSTLSNILQTYMGDMLTPKIDFILVAPMTFNDRKVLLKNIKKIYFLDYDVKKFFNNEADNLIVQCNVITTIPQPSQLHYIDRPNANPYEYLNDYTKGYINIPTYSKKLGLDTTINEPIAITVNMVKWIYLDYDILDILSEGQNAETNEPLFKRILIIKKSNIKL